MTHLPRLFVLFLPHDFGQTLQHRLSCQFVATAGGTKEPSPAQLHFLLSEHLQAARVVRQEGVGLADETELRGDGRGQ